MEAAEPERAQRWRACWIKVATVSASVHQRYARYFWTAHSVWALLTGVVVLVLAHNRYGYLPWVAFFLALTWASTLFFSRLPIATTSRAARLAQGFVSYLTRVMYQETLFFLLPFYFYSTTFPSWNCAFVFLLAGLAALSCFDRLFDRLLRQNRAFALGFLAVVTFSALQLFLPVLLQVRIHLGGYLAAAVAVLAAVPLAFPWREIRQGRVLWRIAIALGLAIVIARALRPIVPPVPLRLSKVRFAGTFDPRTLRAEPEYSGTIPRSALAGGRLYAIATVFSPSRLPAAIVLELIRDGKTLRTSRTVSLIAHSRGFRVWDSVRADRGGFPPGVYHLEVSTGEGQLVGRASIRIVDDTAHPSP